MVENNVIHVKHMQAGKRPQLTEELEAMATSKTELEDLAKSCSSSDLDKKQSESRILRFLVSIYRWCTEKDPNDRPTAENLYNLLLSCADSLSSQQSQEDSWSSSNFGSLRML